MDLGIAGRRALLGGASAGLGRATATALVAEGVDVTIVARRPDVLAEAAASMRDAGPGTVTAVAADMADPAGRQEVLRACPDPDILVNNAGGGPMGDFRGFGHQDWLTVIEATMLSPIEMIKATVDAMVARGFGRILNITTMGMRVPSSLHQLCNGARGGLTAFVSTVADQYVADGVTVNNLLPGPIAGDHMKQTSEVLARSTGEPVEGAYERRVRAHPARRFGEPAELGAFAAFLCSAHAGYITGQNMLVDGGLAKTTF